MKARLEEMEAEVAGISEKGERLTDLVGASEGPVVSTGVSGVSSEYRALNDTWRLRLEQLQAALEQTNKFQAELIGILSWLQGICRC